jgi:hypothetical protein
MSQSQVKEEAWFVTKSSDWVGKLSQPQYEITLDYNVKIPMRDGITLSADVWRPRAEGKFPVILIYTAYDKTNDHNSIMTTIIDRAKYFVPRGYVVVGILEIFRAILRPDIELSLVKGQSLQVLLALIG